MDLCAIAKGHSVDRVAALLERRGYRHSLVEIGGELRARGQKAAGAWFHVGIEAPITDWRAVYTVITLQMARWRPLADHRKYFELQGAALRAHHRPTEGQRPGADHASRADEEERYQQQENGGKRDADTGKRA